MTSQNSQETLTTFLKTMLLKIKEHRAYGVRYTGVWFVTMRCRYHAQGVTVDTFIRTVSQTLRYLFCQ